MENSVGIVVLYFREKPLEDLTNRKLFEFIEACIKDGLDDRAAFNKLRTTYTQEKMVGRTANDRQEKFYEALDTFRKRPAALRLRQYMSRLEEFKESLQEAFDAADIGFPDLRDWYGALNRALQHETAVKDALELLGAQNAEKAASLTEEATWLWPIYFTPEVVGDRLPEPTTANEEKPSEGIDQAHSTD